MATLSRWLLVIPALTLSACAAQVIESHMNPMLGKPVSAVFARLGYPDGETTVAGHRAYVWSNQGMEVLPVVVPTTTAGYVGRVPVNMTTNTYGAMNAQYSCRIRVFVDDSEIV